MSLLLTKQNSKIRNLASKFIRNTSLAPSYRFFSQESQILEEETWKKNIRGGDNELFLQGKRNNTWFTGKYPTEVEGFLSENNTLYSLPQPILENLTYDKVQNYFDNTWTLTEILFSGLQGEEAFYRPPYHHLRHPLVFYYIHTVSFYVNKLLVSGLIQNGINKHFEDIFEVGVDEMSWDDMSKNEMEWPSILECHQYRQTVYNLVSSIIEEHFNNEKGINVGMDDPLWSLFMAFEHERIHFETSSVLFRELPLKLLRKPEYFPDPYYVNSDNDVAVENELIKNNGGTITIGKNRDFPSYGWDNEYGERTLDVPEFRVSKYKVTNDEYLEFVADGGYSTEKYWSTEGWNWRKFRNMKWPFFWKQDGPGGSHKYKLRTIFELVDMSWSSPVIVNYHEAKAFCSWKSEQLNTKEPLRLICEGEHQLMRDEQFQSQNLVPQDDPALNYSGYQLANGVGYNVNLGYGSETPVNLYAPNTNGYYDVSGNVWEWSEDDFNPLNGFNIHKFYEDFSTPCFDGRHKMIFGGSFISTGDNGANLHSRYHFRPHFLQHSGFRYVEPSVHENGIAGNNIARHLTPKEAENNNDNTYETDLLVNQYMALHYGQDIANNDFTIELHDELSNGILQFPQRCGQLVTKFAQKYNNNFKRAFDIGCAVGGSSFELSKSFDYVLGIDLSNAFINKANEMKQNNTVTYRLPKQGNVLTEELTASLLLDNEIRKNNCEFKVGDACNLGTYEDYGGKFDGILMANLLCRLQNPIDSLLQINNLLNINGILVLVSPYSWLHQFTPEENWLGGSINYNDKFNNKESFEIVNDILNNNGFNLIHQQNMPLIIREHQRKYQYVISHATVYIKNKDIN